MRRFILLVTVVLLMTALLVFSAAPALAAATITVKGEAVPPVVCDVTADDSPLIGWRNGTCWVFHPVTV
jgi:type 1 fimbria pilin